MQALPHGTRRVAGAGASSNARTTTKSTRLAELEAVGSAKRKRQALQELAVRKNVPAGTSGTGADERKILALPKKKPTAAVAQRAPPVSHAIQLQQGPATGRSSDVADVALVRRLSSRPSLIPVRQQRENDAALDPTADDAEPLPKRQRTSSVGPEDIPSEAGIGPEDIPSEAEIASELTPHDDDDDEDATAYSAEWEDLDAADHDDPMMASEYVADIQRYLKEVELTTLPTPTYMASQPDLTWAMRAMLNDWLLQVHARFRLLPETIFLSTHLLDRFLSLRAVSASKLQLLGMACLLVASKFEETISPAITNFTAISDDAFTMAEMREAERHVLMTLGWEVSWMGPMHWLRRISKADGYNPRTRQLGKYLAEIVLVDHKLVGTPPSLIAAAAMWLARLALGEGEWVAPRARRSTHDDDAAHKGAVFTLWTPTLAHYATYTEDAVLTTAGHMLRYVLQPVRHESFYRKWAGKKNMKASVYMREWALARWVEGSRVDLAQELPALKREIVMRMQSAESRARLGLGDGAEESAERDGDEEECYITAGEGDETEGEEC
ncbi:cyclin-like protein [Mycena haematopus]|nr:cyclin-like protein [Mycena haematopus]